MLLYIYIYLASKLMLAHRIDNNSIQREKLKFAKLKSLNINLTNICSSYINKFLFYLIIVILGLDILYTY